MTIRGRLRDWRRRWDDRRTMRRYIRAGYLPPLDVILRRIEDEKGPADPSSWRARAAAARPQTQSSR